MRRKVFRVATALPAGEALDRLAQLLHNWGVKVSRESGVVRSINTPIPLGNLDPRVYRNRYWIGVNPFSLITAIDMTVTVSGALTEISVSIDRLRAILVATAVMLMGSVIDINDAAPLGVKIALNAILLSGCAFLMRQAYVFPLEEIELKLSR